MMRPLSIVCAVLVCFCHSLPLGAQGATPEPVVLFDGSGTDGWRQAGPGSFELVDGTLVSRGGMGLFWHERVFGDFVLTLQFKVADRGNNSGVFVRFPDPGNDPWVAVNEGHEIQICDAQEGNQTGAIYDHKNSTETNTKPPGEWNEMEIRVVGQQYTVKINGKVVNEFTANRDLSGHIGIQNHDDGARVSFRDIRVVELPRDPSAQVDAGPKREGVAVRDPQPGLVAVYYRDAKNIDDVDKPPFLVRVEPTLQMSANGEFNGTKLSNDFAVRFIGFLRVPQDGVYELALNSDDDSRLFVHDQIVVGVNPVRDFNPAGHRQTGRIALTTGLHPFRVDYHNGWGGGSLRARWRMVASNDTSAGAGAGAKEDERFAEITPDMLVHGAGTGRIEWDREAWERATWSRKEWVEKYAPGWEKMDYGPFLSHTVQVREGEATPKGITIKLGEGYEDAAVLFDTDLLRCSAGWTDGFLNLDGVVFNGAHGPNPSVRGKLVFTTRAEPGAVAGSVKDKIDDPRGDKWGPLPDEHARYEGLYRHGNKVILAYTVGLTEILEMPSFVRVAGEGVFTRTIRIGASSKPVTLLICDHKNVGVRYPAPVREVSGADGRLYLEFPASDEPKTYTIAVGRGDLPNGVAQVHDDDPLMALTKGGPALWTEEIVTQGTLGERRDGFPYVVDNLTVPMENPYHSWMRFGGLDFFADGTRAALSTWSGDVWVVSGIDDTLRNLRWKRFATGLFQPLGLKIQNDTIYVIGRDQITRLHDLNGDGEADFYENFNNDVKVTPSFHEFALDLQVDPQGNFYFAKAGPVQVGGRGWQIITEHAGTIMKVSPDGKTMETFATGVRAPNGMGMSADGQLTIADNEGTWTPTCRLNLVHQGDFLGVVDLAHNGTERPTTYDAPVCWFPHGDVDNSSGGQVWVNSDRWGPFAGDLLHMSYGKCTLMKVMYEEVDGIAQGGVVIFPLKFDTGICRARFSPHDGQLYVTGLRGWQSDAVVDGALQRVRYTGEGKVNMPTKLNVHADGITITFTDPLDKEIAEDPDSYAIEQWNYVWSENYGSPEVSVKNPGQPGHDPVEIESVTVSADGRSVFLSIPTIQPVMQMKIDLRLESADGEEIEYAIFNTINKLGPARGEATAGGAAEGE